MAEALVAARRARALAPLLLLGACALPNPSSPEPVSQTLEGLVMTQTVRGVPSWRLTSPQATVSPAGQAVLELPEVRFYQGRGPGSAEPGKGDSYGRSRRAVVMPSGDVDLAGEVLLRSKAEDCTLHTEKLRYDGKRKRLHTEDAVVVERPGATMRGRGMDADASLSDITIYQQETVLR